VRRRKHHGYVVLGCNAVARAVARALGDAGEEVVLVDSNPEAVRAAEATRLPVLQGSGIDERVLLAAGIDDRAGCIGLTPNEDVNLVFARTVRMRYRVPEAWVALRRSRQHVTRHMIDQFDGHVLFGEARSVEQWVRRLEGATVSIETWRWAPDDRTKTLRVAVPGDLEHLVLPLVVRSKGHAAPVDERTALRAGDEMVVALESDAAAREWLHRQGWRPAEAREAVA
jgi:Trk K+ transport system NAD-binding subunit